MGDFVTHFFMTLFNYKSNEEIMGMIKTLDPVRAIVCNETCPKTGRLHFHAYVQLRKKRRFSAMGKLFKCHIEEIRKHPVSKEPMYFETWEYCKKDGQYIELGIPPESSLREAKPDPFVTCIDLARQNNLDEIRDLFPKMYVLHLTKWKMIAGESQTKEIYPNRRCLWIHGLSGIGKSRWVTTNFPLAYRKNAEEIQFERYKGEKVIVIEDMMPHHRKDWLHPLLMASDIYPYMPKIRYGSVCLTHELLIVTSNYRLDEIFPHDPSRGISPWQRRFIELHAIAWYEDENDLLIKVGNNIFYFCLKGYLLTHYFITLIN